MDITFKTEEGRFNYRACAIMIHDQKLLAMQDERSPYYYLPGGRVTLHETAEQAILRELEEELGITGSIVRPLWVNQSFFTEDVSSERYHEICIYFLVDITATALMERGEQFQLAEGKHRHLFRWLPFEQLKEEYLYPLFIKEKIFELPEQLELIATHE